MSVRSCRRSRREGSVWRCRRARVVLDAFDRRLGGQAAGHRFAQPAQPAAVVGDHAKGFQNVAMFARTAVVAAVDEGVDRGAHRVDRLFEPVEFKGDVVSDDLAHRNARLMEDDMPQAQAFGDRLAGSA